ncbi:MAG: hypothetical protein R8K20_07655, partial [Gallionellaceae bacterium]
GSKTLARLNVGGKTYCSASGFRAEGKRRSSVQRTATVAEPFRTAHQQPTGRCRAGHQEHASEP